MESYQRAGFYQLQQHDQHQYHYKRPRLYQLSYYGIGGSPVEDEFTGIQFSRSSSLESVSSDDSIVSSNSASISTLHLTDALYAKFKKVFNLGMYT